mgnify:CR=1 FL=1
MRENTWMYLSNAEVAEQTPLSRRVGERIRALRKSRKWARWHLARRLGVHTSRLAHWERGESEPPLAMLLALARVLEVSIEELAGAEPRARS